MERSGNQHRSGCTNISAWSSTVLWLWCTSSKKSLCLIAFPTAAFKQHWLDPMHNLLLGTAKHMVDVWRSLALLTDTKLEHMQMKINNLVSPNDIGRIPSKIASNFSGFTAEQWRNWKIFFSLHVLLAHFCQSLPLTMLIHCLWTIYYQRFVSLYGKDWCTLNLHLHGHLWMYTGLRPRVFHSGSHLNATMVF